MNLKKAVSLIDENIILSFILYHIISISLMLAQQKGIFKTLFCETE